MKTKQLLQIFLITSLCLITACQKQEKPTVSVLTDEKKYDSAEELLEQMTLEEKIGQLFIIRPESLDSSLTNSQVHDPSRYGVTALSQSMIDTLQNYPVGGICMFSKNILNPDQIKTFTHDLQKASSIHLLMGIDEEGGSVSRIANNKNFHVTQYQNMAAIGQTNDQNQAYQVGQTIGHYLKEYSFNLDFAPVADVNTNPDNPVTGVRSFGRDATLVGQMVSEEIKGFHSENMMTCIKHFPGHGDTKTDTHLGYATTSKTWQDMQNCELIPFLKGIESHTDMIMVSHITALQVTNDHLPSSLSYEMISERLKNELGYDGIIITDSLAMQAITNQYSSSQAAVQAFEAGNDILLMPQDYKEAFKGIKEAVQNKEISETRLNHSVLKILRLKAKYKLI